MREMNPYVVQIDKFVSSIHKLSTVFLELEEKNDIFTEAWCKEMQYEIGLFIKRCCTEGISAKNVKYSIMRLLNEMELYLEQNYKDIILTEIFGDKEYIGYQEVEDFDSAEQLEKELKKTLEMALIFLRI